MPSRPKDRFRLFEAKPSLGGALVSRGSSDNAGIFNYIVKRDWRRDLDVEQRREGYDYFAPSLDLSPAVQAFPGQIQLDSLTFAAGTVTATRSEGQWFENGESIIITGANDPGYNGTFTIKNATSTSFQYTIGAVPVSPDTSKAIFATPIEEINLLGMARRPNGKTAVIAGSARRLYRYYALEDPNYTSISPADYPPATPANEDIYWSVDPADYPPGTPVSQLEYIDSHPGYWIVIGSGYAVDGNRWEIVPTNGYLVFNNGVDLMVTYRVEDLEVVPIYELREQGIAAVGTIAEIDGILMIADLSEIQTAALGTWFTNQGQVAVDSLTFAVVMGVPTVTATIAAGVPFTLNESVIITGAVHPEYNGTFAILSVTPTQFTYAITGAPASPDPSAFIFATPTTNLAPYGRFTDTEHIDRTTYRVGWSPPGEPRRWGPVYAGAVIFAGSTTLELAYAVLGLSVGQNITIVGAGASHAGGTADNLTANILYVNGRNIILDTPALTTVIGAKVQATDIIGSIIGFEDLQDDGSGILKMLPLADQLVIYKDTTIFVAQYLGTPDQPFAFSPRRIQKEQSLFYRNTLILAETPNEIFHIYAGRNSFYRFDLTNQQPMILPHFESCSNIFYAQASLANTEHIFAADNGITHEILFAFPQTTPGPDWGVIWDYKQDTISTTAVQITAMATIRKPLAGLSSGAEEDWCILGNGAGTVMLYGKTDLRQALPDWGNSNQIFFQRGSNPYSATRNPYPSVIAWGLGTFGNDPSEKDVRFLLPLFASQSPNTTTSLSLYKTQNANRPTTLVGTKVFANPETQNLMQVAARGFLFQAQLTVNGIDNPDRLVGLAWSVAPVDSRSASRA